ncbi:MAG: veratrol--corrinoid protein metyltransferase [Coriobacteriia bacterium]|nr:veratrol--corrinoid protein metyltransferase [Coriobacteriia bacterium]
MPLTEKENYMRVVNGEIPEWVPRTSFASPGFPPATGMAGPLGFGGEMITDDDGNIIGFRDRWGVEYVSTKETSNAALPVPNKFILDDIRNWRDVIKAPEIPDLDWAEEAKKGLERFDRTQTAIYSGSSGYFLPLVNFMGFTEGLCAMIEEPDEVMALFEYMHEYYSKVNQIVRDFYRPDLFSLSDDIAAAGALFVSPEIYRQLVKPWHDADAKPFRDAGIPIAMHCCGLCEDIVPDWVEMGVRVWQPAQIQNDLLGIKETYKGVLALEGCFDSHGPANYPHAPEELVRQAVRDCIDTYAPGGGFIFWASTYGDLEDPDTANKARWITEEYDAYGRTFYQK